jgi:alkaline phosphatase D
MQNSEATWKIWCNEMPMMRVGVEVGPAGVLLFDRVAFCDAWDDKPTERAELLTFLKDQSIGNVVVITGDIHAHFAGTLMDDFDSDTPTPVATEFVSAGISSNSLFSFFEFAVRGQPQGLRDLVTFDATQFGGDRILENNLNVMLRFGTGAAQVAAQTGDPEQILAAADPNANPHMAFADCNAQGYGLMQVSPSGVEATLVTINRPTEDLGDAGQGIAGTATFQVAVDEPGGLSEPTLSGRKPFPLT